jgi:hypothetical protein
MSFKYSEKVKGKTIPLQAYYSPRGFQEVEAPSFGDIHYLKLVKLLALGTGHLYLQEIFLLLNLRSIVRPEGYYVNANF